MGSGKVEKIEIDKNDHKMYHLLKYNHCDGEPFCRDGMMFRIVKFEESVSMATATLVQIEP